MSSSPYSRLAVLSLTHIVNDANLVILSTVIPLIVKEFSLSYTEAGLAVNISFLSMIFLQILFGHLSGKTNLGYMLALGLFIIGLCGFLTALANSFYMLLVAQLLMGVGASFYHPIAYGLTRYLYEEGARGKAFGLVTSSGDLGVLIVFIASGVASVFYGWRFPVIMFSLLAIVVGILSLRYFDLKGWGQEKTVKTIKDPSIIKVLILILIAYILVVSVNRISYSYIPLILAEYVSNQAVINLNIATLTLFGIISGLISGAVIDRYNVSLYTVMITIFMVISPLILIQYTTNPFLVFSTLALLGFVIYAHKPIIYSYILGGSISGNFGTIYGLTVSLGMVGGLIASIATGIFADFYGIHFTMIISSGISLVVLVIYLYWLNTG